MFQIAKPVFPKGKSEEKNIYAVFNARLESLKDATLYLTAATYYRVTVNGKFVAFGPARAAEGFAREDVLPLGSYHSDGGNELLIEVCGYYSRAFASVMQPSFLWAEVRSGSRVLAATSVNAAEGVAKFDAYLPETRRQKTQRYSVQRYYTEVWDWRDRPVLTPFDRKADPEEIKAPRCLDRIAPYPEYNEICVDYASVGTLRFRPDLQPRRNYYSFQPSERWGRFESCEIEDVSYERIQTFEQIPRKTAIGFPFELKENEYAFFDFSQIEVGFLRTLLSSLTDSDVIVAFSEDGPSDRFAFTDTHAHNVISYHFAAGQTGDFMSFEPYVLRYALIAVTKGTVQLNGFGVTTFTYPIHDVKIPPICDEKLRSVYRGAVRTFAHNSVDAFMDCPSRERAGWLCDSYFTAQTEYELFGKTPVEQAFLENFRLFRNNGEIPDGMIPMTYPSDIEDGGKFIPQWSMWFILELADHLLIRNPDADAEPYRPVVMGLLNFYRRYENSDGLLEKLPSWNFVEWSVANEWTQDVNYPTNFLYAQVLERSRDLFGDERLYEKARKIRKIAAEQSFDGRFFRDHAVRENGTLKVLGDMSEAGQYYAILFGDLGFSDEKYASLFHNVREVFGAIRRQHVPEVAEINAFIGVYLRLEALMKMGEWDLLLRDIREFFGEMEQKTGTLWEYRQPHGSRDHGFASFALVAMCEALRHLGRGAELNV